VGPPAEVENPLAFCFTMGPNAAILEAFPCLWIYAASASKAGPYDPKTAAICSRVLGGPLTELAQTE